MTALNLRPSSLVDTFDDPAESTASKIDREVEVTRSKPRDPSADMRAKPRFSVRELNDLDLETLREHMRASSFDTRGPVTRFLDLLDVPRNTIASIAFPSIERRKKQEGETGTFGRGTVRFSDILGELGMRPGIARGLLGFVGDVVTDPLTYVGVGGAAKTLSGAGQTVKLARSGTRALRGGIKAVAASEEISNPVVKNLFRETVRPEALERLSRMKKAPVTPQEQAAFFSRRVFGPTSQRKGIAARFLKPEFEEGGSQIAGRFNRPANTSSLSPEQVEAVSGIGASSGKGLKGFRQRLDARTKAYKDFVGEYSIAAKPGEGKVGLFRREGQTIPSVRVGSGGSMVAHIPFTDIGIYAPPFTANARAAVAQRAAAAAREGKPYLGGVIGTAFNAARDNSDLAARISQLNEQIADAAKNGDELGHSSGISFRNELVQKARANIENMRREYDAIIKSPVADADLGIGDLQYLRQMKETAESAARLAEAKTKWFPFSQQLAERLKTESPSTALASGFAKKGKQTLLSAAEGAAKGERLQELNAAKVGVTDPATLASIDEQIKAVRSGEDPAVLKRAEEIAYDRYSENQRKLMSMQDEDIDSAVARADAMHSQMEASWRMAERTRGAISQFIDSPVSEIADNARIMLGLGPDALGTSIFTPYTTVAQSVSSNGEAPFQNMLEDASRLGREVFGNRRAAINDPRSRMVRMMRSGAVDVANAVMKPVQDQFDSLAKKYAWTADQQDAAQALLFARLYQTHPNASEALYLTDMAGNPSKFVTLVEDAKNLGLDTPDKIAEIDKIANDARAIMEQIGDIAVDTGSMKASQNLDLYAPRRLDPAFKQLMDQRSIPGMDAAPKSDDFAKTSKTWQYRFTGADGKPKRFFEMDRWLAGLTDEQIDAMELPEVLRTKMQEIRDTVLEFDALHRDVPMELRPQLLGKQTDVFELNDLGNKGYFDYLTGRTDAGVNVFSDNLIYAARNRVAEQAKAAARQSWEQHLGKYGVDVASEVYRTQAGNVGNEFVMANGMRGSVAPGGRVRIGGEMYRPLKNDISVPGSLMDGVLTNRDMMKLYPEKVAEQIERAVDWTKDAGNTNSILKAVDQVTGVWKALALARPAWVVFNVVGNLWNMGMGGVDLARSGKFMRPVYEMLAQGKDPAALLNKLVDLRGVPTNLDQLRMDAIERGVLNTDQASEMLQMLYPDGSVIPYRGEATGVRAKLAAKGQEMRDTYRKSIEASLRARAVDEAPTAGEKLKAAATAARDTKFLHHFLNPFAAANSFVENWMRMLSYVTLIDQGVDPAVAAIRTKEFLFDFTDMTGMEANIRRYAVPFYSWVRNNGAYQVRQFLQQPAWAALYPKVKEAVEEAVAGEQQLPEHMRPTWMRDQLTTQLSEDPNSRAGFTAANVLPVEPVAQLGAALTQGAKGLGSGAKYLTGSLNPVLSGVVQLGAGREFFSGREIGSDATEGDITQGEFLYNQIAPGLVKDFVSVGTRTAPGVQAFGRSTAEGLLRLGLGGRVQPMDDKRIEFQNMREFKDREERIRKAIAVAEREGNAEASQVARARLLQLWQRAIQLGLEDGVPKYGREQLGRINALQASGV